MTVFKGNIFTQNGDKLEERIKMAKKYRVFSKLRRSLQYEVLYIILKNFSLNLLSKMFVLTGIIDCMFLLFYKILSPVLSISPLY
jgi:hypothetical protein